MNTSDNPDSIGIFGHAVGRFNGLGLAHRRRVATPVYQLTDRLHNGRTARVRGDEIGATVSAWLAELGAHSPLVDDLHRAVKAGDWQTTHALEECLSIEVAVAA